MATALSCDDEASVRALGRDTCLVQVLVQDGIVLAQHMILLPLERTVVP